MKKASKKFTLYAMLSVFVLLTLLLGIINGVNFTMAAADADAITQMISEQNGALRYGPFGQQPPELPAENGQQPPDAPSGSGEQPQETPFDGSRQTFEFRRDDPGRGMFGQQGPNSPELAQTVRYFTVVFGKKDAGEVAAFEISAVDQSEAIAWARSLLNR